ncbi:MAG: hypothetical protein ACO1N7_09015 [Sphingobacteriaceae bacterium]
MKAKVFIPEQRVGIWLDHEQAFIFQINEQHQYEMNTIQSGIDEKEQTFTGKKISRFKRMFFNQDKEQRRRHQRLLKFFENIIHQVRNADYIYLFGPGNLKHELNHFIEKAGKRFALKVIAIDTADKMTAPQMVVQVKDYFKSLSFQDAQRQLALREF